MGVANAVVYTVSHPKREQHHNHKPEPREHAETPFFATTTKKRAPEQRPARTISNLTITLRRRLLYPLSYWRMTLFLRVLRVIRLANRIRVVLVCLVGGYLQTPFLTPTNLAWVEGGGLQLITHHVSVNR